MAVGRWNGLQNLPKSLPGNERPNTAEANTSNRATRPERRWSEPIDP